MRFNELGLLKYQATTTSTTTSTTTTPPTTTRVNIVNATYPKKQQQPPKKPVEVVKVNATKQQSSSGERVYVVTPVPSRNSVEQPDPKSPGRRRPKGKEQRDTVSVEQAYQVLPQAVNNLAVVSSVPNSAAPVLWGIMEHEEVTGNLEQPRWRSESDALSEAEPPDDSASVPVLYSGHSKVL